jgi:hypothetical protein
MGVIEVNFEIFEFFGTQTRIKKISIPSIVWVEENADFLKFISITPSYFYIKTADFHKGSFHWPWKTAGLQNSRLSQGVYSVTTENCRASKWPTFTRGLFSDHGKRQGFKTANFRKGSIQWPRKMAGLQNGRLSQGVYSVIMENGRASKRPTFTRGLFSDHGKWQGFKTVDFCEGSIQWPWKTAGLQNGRLSESVYSVTMENGILHISQDVIELGTMYFALLRNVMHVLMAEVMRYTPTSRSIHWHCPFGTTVEPFF